MIWFDLGCFQLVEFPLGWHTDTYRVVATGPGAFELCLPSLGILYQIELLRCENIHRTPSMTWSWGPDLGGHLGPWCSRHVGLQHSAMPRVGLSIGASHLHRWPLWVPYSPSLMVCRIGSGQVVTVGNGATRPEFCVPMWVYQCLPTRETKPKSK